MILKDNDEDSRTVFQRYSEPGGCEPALVEAA